MRSDESKDTRRDISADELLRQLHESVARPVAKSAKSDAKTKRLTLDDEVVENAERAAKVDSTEDVDIEALIGKYMSRIERKPSEVTLDETPDETSDEAPDETPEELEELEEDVKVYEPDVETEPLPEAEEAVEEFAEDVVDEPIEDVTEDIADEAAEPEAEPVDASATAVFDIQRVHELTALVEADPDGATEVFKRVAVDDTPAEKTYGDPSAEDIDQTDLHLMIAFGMNDELKDTVGEEKATELEDELEKERSEQADDAKHRSEQHYEYTSREQNDEILSKYQSSYYGTIARIFLAALLFGLTFLLENCALIGLELPTFMKPEAYPVVYAMLDLQCLVFGGALIWRQLSYGVKDLVTLKPTVDSLTAFALLLAAIYTAVSAIVAPRGGFGLYNLPVMALVILALVYEFLALKRDVFSFSVVSTKKKKFVVSPVPESDSAPEQEVFSEYLGDEAKIIRVGRTDFVDGFFARVGARSEATAKPLIGMMLPAVLIVAVAFFTVGFIKGQNAYEALKLAYIAATLTLPIGAYVVYSYPFYRASRQAYDADSAIIGEGSLGEYAGSAVISFEDKEVFPPKGVKVTSIKVYGNNRIDEIIYNLASAFMTVGGPLAEVFSQATHDLGHSENVEIEEVDEDGFIVTIDDIQVAIGKAPYMERLDFEPAYDSEDKQAEQSAGIGIFYVAYQGELAAKVYVQYTIDAEFEKILAQLYKTGMCVGIKSFDPNINDLLLSKKLKSVKYPVKVIRSRNAEDIPHSFDHCESGIVSKRSVKNLLRTVASCERVSSAIKSAQLVKVVASLIGLVIMILLTAFDTGFEIRSIWTAVYQLVWIVPLALLARISV